MTRPHSLHHLATTSHADHHQRDAQYLTIDITQIALIVLTAVLGVCALFTRRTLAMLFLAAALFAALGVLALGINAEWVTALNTAVETWFQRQRSPTPQHGARTIFRFFAQPQNVLAAVVICGILLSLLARSAVPILLLLGAVAAAVAVEKTLKALVTERTAAAVAELQHRPLDHYEHAFPSGHVAGSAALLGMIAVCLGAGHSRAVKIALAVPVFIGVCFVAFIALYAPAHTFVDVIGGFLLGAAVVALGAAVSGATNSRRASRKLGKPEQRPQLPAQ